MADILSMILVVGFMGAAGALPFAVLMLIPRFRRFVRRDAFTHRAASVLWGLIVMAGAFVVVTWVAAWLTITIQTTTLDWCDINMGYACPESFTDRPGDVIREMHFRLMVPEPIRAGCYTDPAICADLEGLTLYGGSYVSNVLIAALIGLVSGAIIWTFTRPRP